jgi:hypothetical protein
MDVGHEMPGDAVMRDGPPCETGICSQKTRRRQRKERVYPAWGSSRNQLPRVSTVAQAQRQDRKRRTYNVTNLRGPVMLMAGKRKKEMAKQAAAPRLHAPNISSRSHLLTTNPSQPS